MIRASTRSAVSIRRQVARYVKQTLAEGAVVGKLERLAVIRYRDDLANANERGLRFDETAATRAVNFFPLLRLSTGEYAGQPFELADFQVFIVWNLFGWYRGSVRRFRDAFISLGRGNGKSPFAAALILYLWGFDYPKEPRAECYTVATKRDQAKIVFDESKRMVEAQPSLRSHVKNHLMALSLGDGSTLRPLGSDSKNTDGLVIHGIVLDELHAWREQHRGLYEKIETAMGKRRQPLSITITTAGSDESVLWEEQYTFAKSVLEGATPADSHFAFSCEIDDDDDPLDEAVWPKANPLLKSGVVKIQHLRDMADKAASRPDMREEFRRYHCNRRCWSTAKFITPELWETGNKPLPELNGMECYGGFDWGWADDLAGFGWVFRVGESEVDSAWRPVYAMVVDAFLPAGGKRDLSRDPWKTWIDNSAVTVTDSEHVDPYAIFKNVERRASEWHIHKIGFDRFNCDPLATRVIHELGIEMVQFPQSYAAFHAPTIEFRNALSEGRLIHGGDPLAGWCAQNMVKRDSPDGQYAKPSKQRSADKIDPIVAVIMALGEAMYAQHSVYESSGNLAL
jgi:phage terminase large subunit-like protein